MSEIHYKRSVRRETGGQTVLTPSFDRESGEIRTGIPGGRQVEHAANQDIHRFCVIYFFIVIFNMTYIVDWFIK